MVITLGGEFLGMLFIPGKTARVRVPKKVEFEFESTTPLGDTPSRSSLFFCFVCPLFRFVVVVFTHKPPPLASSPKYLSIVIVAIRMSSAQP